MKKRYLVLALIILMFSLSVVSASENVSASSDALSIDNNDLSLIDESGDGIIKSNDPNVETIAAGNSEVNSTDSGNGTHGTSGDNNKTTDDKPVSKPKPAKVTNTEDITATYGTLVYYKVKVLDKDGNPIEGQKVTLTVVGRGSVTKYTDAKGMANVSCNCPAGSYKFKYTVGTLTGYNNYIVKNKISLTVLNWGLKGDVTKNALIKKNMPNNAWVKKVVDATKRGIPLLTIKGDKNGKVIFMTAGVHGNEISSQVAAMKMINYLTKTPVKGTVYFMPFVNVKAISKKVRYTDKDFNRIAHKSGTIPNKIVKLVKRYKCDAYGDFHTTKPGGAPGKNIVMGSKTPAAGSAKLTKYIATKCKVNQRIYKYAGQQYPGAINDNVNKLGIPAVICEVMLPHNTVTAKTVKTSYNMMTYLLKYYSVI